MASRVHSSSLLGITRSGYTIGTAAIGLVLFFDGAAGGGDASELLCVAAALGMPVKLSETSGSEHDES